MSDKRPGVIVDVDGTMLDTNYLHVVAWIRAFRENGFEDLAMSDVLGAIGIASEGLVEKLVDADQEVTDAIVKAHSRNYEAFTDDVRAFTRAGDLLRACDDRGLAVTIATSGKKDDLEWMLPAIGVDEDLLATATTSGDVEASKPAPEPMQATIDAAGLDPKRTVALGDTVWDVQAAQRTGIPCITFTCGGIDEATLRDAGAAQVWASPADLLAHLDDSLLGRLAD